MPDIGLTSVRSPSPAAAAVIEEARLDPINLALCSVFELGRLEEAIGDTPLVRVEALLRKPRAIHLKLEGSNPGASLKDRIARFMIDRLERRGELRAGATLVDSTSGNFGIAMAWLAQSRGYRFIAVSDPKLTVENAGRLRSLGAVLEIVDELDPEGGYLSARIARAQTIADRYGAIWVNQYANSDNPRAHYVETGPELLNQTTESIDAVFIPASTGGTLAGVGGYLKSQTPNTWVVAVDGQGSVMFGGRPGPRTVNGLGSSRKSEFLTSVIYDDVVRVSATDAFAYCRELAQVSGIQVGGSSGAAIAAAVTYLDSRPNLANAICICPDHGANYQSTIFNDAWLAAHGFNIRLPGVLRLP